MKTVISIMLTITMFATATLTNFVLITNAEVFAVDDIYTLVDVDGDVFVLTNCPDLNVGDGIKIIFYTPYSNLDDWQILYAEEH